MSSEMVDWLSIGNMHSTILRNDEKSASLFGRVAQGFVVRKRRADFIGARDVGQRDGVRGRFDVRYVEFFQLFDVAQNPAKLCGEFFFLVGRERDAREMRDVFDINFSGSHEGSFKFQVSSFKLKRWRSSGEGREKFQITKLKSKTRSFLVKLAFDERFNLGDGLGRIVAVGMDGEFAAGAGGEHHQSHYAFAVDFFAVLFHEDVAREPVGGLDEECGGPGMDARACSRP